MRATIQIVAPTAPRPPGMPRRDQRQSHGDERAQILDIVVEGPGRTAPDEALGRRLRVARRERIREAEFRTCGYRLSENMRHP
jgi:hypothetical protein